MAACEAAIAAPYFRPNGTLAQCNCCFGHECCRFSSEPFITHLNKFSAEFLAGAYFDKFDPRPSVSGQIRFGIDHSLSDFLSGIATGSGWLIAGLSAGGCLTPACRHFARGICGSLRVESTRWVAPRSVLGDRYKLREMFLPSEIIRDCPPCSRP